MNEPLPPGEALLLSYIDGELKEPGLSAFKKQLETDPGLQESLLRLQAALCAVNCWGTREKVKSIHAEMMQERIASVPAGKVIAFRRFLRYSGIAATILFVLLAALAILRFYHPTANKLFREAYVDYTVAAERGAGTSSAIETYYAAGKSDEVILAARAGKAVTPEDSLLTGISFLKKDDAASAVPWLLPLSEKGVFRDDAQFYLSLSYLKLGAFDKASRLMENIIHQPGHTYQKQFTQRYVDKVKELED